MTQRGENIGRKENSYEASPRGWGLETIRQGREKNQAVGCSDYSTCHVSRPCDSGIAPLKEGEALGVGTRKREAALFAGLALGALCPPRQTWHCVETLLVATTGRLQEVCAIAL